MKINEVPGKIKVMVKGGVGAIPEMSFPMFTKIYGAEARAVASRLIGYTKHRTIELDKEIEIYGIMKTFFSNTNVGTFKNSVTVNWKRVEEWILERPDAVRIDKKLMELAREGQLVHQFHKWNVHAKLESILRDDVPKLVEQADNRIIVWLEKGVSCLFSEAFKIIKSNLSGSLNSKCLYADGYTSSELARRARVIKCSTDTIFFEADLEKQDRQTDELQFEVELEIFKIFGMTTDMVALWKTTKNNWRLKGKFTKAMLNLKRCTGEPATSLANLITNLTVNWRFIDKNVENLDICLFLGDDFLAIFNDSIDSFNYEDTIRLRYNMVTVCNENRNHGTFLRMICYKDGNVLGMGPDFVRLRRRFELTNGVSEVNEEILEARCLSYMMMLGKLGPVEEIDLCKKYELELPTYYNPLLVMHAICEKYKMTEDEVRNNLNTLIKYIKERKIIKFEFKGFVGTPYG